MHLDPGGGHKNPFQYSCLENSMDKGVWRGTVHGVCKEWDTTEWLSMDPRKNYLAHCYQGFPGGSDSNRSACIAGDMSSNPGSGRVPWRRETATHSKMAWWKKWQTSPVFLPTESHEQRNLEGYLAWGHRVWHNSATIIHNASEILECWKGQEKRVKWRQEHGAEGCYCSITKLCPTLCDPVDSNMPGFSVLHCLVVCSNSCPSNR